MAKRKTKAAKKTRRRAAKRATPDPRYNFNPFQIRPGGPHVDPENLSLEETAAMISEYDGQRCTVEDVRARIAAGMPTNPDGTINLISSLAWMLRELNGVA